MKHLLLVCILCGGCATPVDELYDNAKLCGPDTEERCKPLWNEYMERVEQRERTLAKRNMTCLGDDILVNDGRRQGCMSRRDVEKWMRGRY